MSAVLNVFNIEGEKVENINIKENIFNITPNKKVMNEVLIAELAAARQGSANTKTRSEVRGGGRKPYKQKGTGRARQGTIRSPILVGGGVVFGPKPRSYEKKINKKVRKLALKSALSEKFKDNKVLVMEDFNLEKPNTKKTLSFFNKLNIPSKQLIVIENFNKSWNTYLSFRNLRDIMIVNSKEIGIYWLLKQDNVIFTKDSLKKVEEVLS